MAGKIVDRLPHSCGASRALNVFENEDGTYSGYCFSCKTSVANPYSDKEEGYKPKKVATQSPEQVKKELDAITNKFPVRELKDRVISKETCEYLGIKVAVSQENGYDITSHYYPYTIKGDIVGYKVRVVEGKSFFGMGRTDNVEPFGWEQCMRNSPNNAKVFVAEGECFEPDTEVFTNKGWIKFKDLMNQDSDLLIGQVEPDSGVMTFTPSFKYISKPFEGELIKMKVKGYEVTTTPEHNIAYIGNNGKWLKQPANKHSSVGWSIPRVSYLDGVGTGLSDTEKALVIAICADSSLSWNQDGSVHARFAVDKDRKAERIRDILEELDIKYTYTFDENRHCRHYFGFRVPEYAQSKELPKDWLTSATLEERHFILEELPHWDGNFVKGRLQTEYSSKHESECIKVQTLAHTAGICSTVMKRTNEHGTWYKTSILWNKKHTSNQAVSRERVPYKGQVYCVNVPTGYIQVRCNGKVSVVGNCDVASIHETFKLHGDRTPCVISLPNGAGSVGKIKEYIEILRQQFRDIVLVPDQDEAGSVAEEDFLKLCPEAKIAKLELKDPNAMLKAGRTQELYKAIMWDAAPRPTGKTVMSGDKWDEAEEQAERGLDYPWPTMTKFTRGIRRGEVYYFGGGVKLGKSCIVNELAVHLLKMHDLPIFLIKPEEAIKKTLKKLAGVQANTIFDDPDIPFDKKKWDKAKAEIGNRVALFDTYAELDWESVKKDIRYNVTVLGCKDVFLDPLTCLTVGKTASETNEELIKIAAQFASLAKELDFTGYVFCHLNNPSSGAEHNRGGKVLSSQFAGSRAMARFCHLMVGLQGNKNPELDENTRNTRQLVILEARDYDTGIVDLFYNKETGRLLEPQQH